MVEIATTDELRDNLDKYLQMVDDGNEVILIRNGRNLGRILPKTSGESIVNSLIGFLKSDADSNEDLDDEHDERHEYFKEKYGLTD